MTLKTTKRADARKSLLTGASVLAAAAAMFSASPAAAQDEVDEDEAIVVTGTRLVRQDFEAISPVTTVGSEQLELTATLTTDSLLNELPQIIPGNTRTSNNAGGFDFATVDLRGLGPQRTLVLVNGERLPVSSTAGAVDINTIPASLISRIEVVTGGASAVYGSDAMSGVINFVLKDDYEGAEVTMTYGAELETGNAPEFEINGLVGGNFANGRGNITTYASYLHRDGVLQSEYDYSRMSQAICYDGTFVNGQYHVVPCDNRDEAIAQGLLGPFFSGGSVTPPWGVVLNAATNPFQNLSTTSGGILAPFFAAGNADTNCDGSPDAAAVSTGNLSFNDAGQLTPQNASQWCAIPDRAIGSSRYNFAPDNMLMIPAERVALTTSGHYDISDAVRLNFLITYSNSRTAVQLAATPATNLVVNLTPGPNGSAAYIQANHPDLWAALQSRGDPLAPFQMHRRFNEVGTRNQFLENNQFLFLTGLDGSLGENWDWNLSASYGQVLFNTRSNNSVNSTALQQGLAGCVDASGDPLGAAALPGCVQLDIFGAGTLDEAMVDFIRVNTFNDTIIEENRIAGFVRGDLFELPAGPIASVFGFEYRDTFAGSYNDNEQRTGNIAGFNAVQDQEGQVDVYELYTEMAIPLISEQSFAHYLGLELGYRRSNYSSIGNVDTYKIGGEWAPVEWLRFRGVFNEATRAPNVFELFQGGDQGFPNYNDPCEEGLGNEADCIAAPGDAAINPAVYFFNGAPVEFEQENSQVQVFAFGNPDLRPETAETTTYGVVFTPDWFPLGDLRASIDYYDIEITDVIAAVGPNFFLADCYQNLTASSCARIVRDPNSGQVLSVDTSTGNQASLATEGYDIQVEWSVPIGPGQLTINELYSILEAFTFTGESGIPNELAGGTSAFIGGALPDYKSVLSVSYSVGDWTLFGRWSYVPEMFSNGICATYAACDDTPEASYFDASVRWNVTDAFTLTAVIDNVFDEYPPQTAEGTFSQANTDPQVYRVLGRSFAVSGRYRF
jgi:iron complex outermembrane recepter protein